MNEKELLNLKKKIDAAESSEQQLKGRKKELLVQLKDDFECETTKEAKTKKKELETELNKVKSKLETKLDEIKAKYNGSTD